MNVKTIDVGLSDSGDLNIRALMCMAFLDFVNMRPSQRVVYVVAL